LDDYEDDVDDPFPHFLDTATVEASEEILSPSNIELQSSEPTTDNITSFIHQSDYSGDEIKEFHFLIDQGFNIDEASDLVYQRRLNTLPSVDLPISGVPSLFPPLYDMSIGGNNISNHSNAGIPSNSLSPIPIPTTPPPPSYNAAMAMSPSYPAPISVPILPPQPAMQHPPPYSQRSGQTPGHIHVHDLMHQSQSPSHHQQFPLPPQPQSPPHQSPQPLQIKRIPLRANALSGNKEADLQQLLERGYTYEQATEICEIIYADRSADQQRREGGEQLPRQGNAGMSVAGSSMSGGMKKKRSGRKHSKRNLIPDVEAVKLATLVSEQEAEYGLNMYDSLQTEDEDIIADFMSHGYSLDEAVFEVFTNKVRKLIFGFCREEADFYFCCPCIHCIRM
jgi:hypothetical protein